MPRSGLALSALSVAAGFCVGLLESCAASAGSRRIPSSAITSALYEFFIAPVSSLPQEKVSRRMVRTVDLNVAIGAATIKILDRSQRLWLRRVAARYVAGIAHARHAHLQQLRIIASMGLVAVGAVLHHRRVLPQERTTALRMAAQAVLVHCSLDQLARIRRAMRIVAAGARYLALAIRHVRRTLQLGATHLVALEAKFR